MPMTIRERQRKKRTKRKTKHHSRSTTHNARRTTHNVQQRTTYNVQQRTTYNNAQRTPTHTNAHQRTTQRTPPHTNAHNLALAHGNEEDGANVQHKHTRKVTQRTCWGRFEFSAVQQAPKCCDHRRRLPDGVGESKAESIPCQ
jgi:hypothetical protein